VHGSELSGERADKRDLIAHVLRAERMSPSTVVMIGDRSHDVIGARANGLRSVAVLWGYGSRHELVEAGADVLFASVAELVSHLASERSGVVSATTSRAPYRPSRDRATPSSARTLLIDPTAPDETPGELESM
jgi:HAD-hyrolase-like